MPNPQTRIDLPVVEKCVAQFPDGEGWMKMTLPVRGERRGLSWEVVKTTLPPKPAVYAFFLPCEFFTTDAMITLHAKEEEGEPTEVDFWFTPPKINVDGTDLALVYIGKTTNLFNRKQLHFRPSTRTARQVHAAIEKIIANTANEETARFGLLDALSVMIDHAEIRYYVIDDLMTEGMSNAANRDLIEMRLIGQFAPPFNIKAER